MIKLASKHKPLTKTDQQKFKSQLKSAVVEKDVEAAYKHVFQRYYGTNFSSPYGSDGYMEPNQASLFEDDLRLFIEVKFGLDLTMAKERAKIVAQTIYYLKKFETDGKPLPNVIVGGDENQMFTIYAPKLKEYLARDYAWHMAPSNAWRDNEPLYRELLDDPNLNVYVFDVRSSAFDINEVFRNISSLSQHHEEFEKLRVTEANIRVVFDEFVRVVWGNEWLTGIKKLGPAETVSVFIQSILGNPDTYIVPTKKNVLHIAGGKEITINAGSYDAFFSRYDRKYSVREIDTVTAVADQLIEEIKRRFHGDFWTPTVWANRAIEMMDKDLGEGWRDRYTVWDPAAGTKNLTRDYQFKKLFTSTLHQAEIDMSAQYNQEATSFQYDFLNDDIDISPTSDPRDIKMPPELFAALKNNEPIVFYTNPPYGQATNMGADGSHKAGIADTRTGELMRHNKLGLAAAELYLQFFWRVQKLSNDFTLTNVSILFFHKAFLASPTFSKFTDKFLDQFRFNGGFMFNAGEFQGTSSGWGIVFSNFSIGLDGNPPQVRFDFSIEKAGDSGIEKITDHTLRRLNEGEIISAWLREIKLSKEEFNDGRYPQMSSAFAVSEGNNPRGRLVKGSIGYMVNNADSVQESERTVSIQTTSAYRANGTSVTPENFERACVTFAVRKSILRDASWINDKDIFRRPSDALQNSPAWNEFVADCVVYSLFHRSSYQTSLRQFEYGGEYYNVANEWFYMSRGESMELAEQYGLAEVVYDARSSSERYVYQWLSGRELSREAQALLDAGRELVRATYTKRFMAASEHPEWHLMAWDAGYYQAYKITTMYKEEFADVTTQLTVARGALEAKLRHIVYADGILEQ